MHWESVRSGERQSGVGRVGWVSSRQYVPRTADPGARLDVGGGKLTDMVRRELAAVWLPHFF